MEESNEFGGVVSPESLVPVRPWRRTRVWLAIASVIFIFLAINGLRYGPAKIVAPGTNQATTTTTPINLPKFDWVVFSKDNTVQEISLSDGQPLSGKISVANDPVAIVDDPTGLQLYVVAKGSNVISVVNLYSYKTYKTLKVGPSPIAITINPKTAVAYVINQGDSTITPIKLLGLKVQPAFSAGPDPSAITTNSSGTTAYICEASVGEVLPVDLTTNPPTPLAPIAVGTDPVAIALDPTNGKYLYVVNKGSGSISVIDTSSNQVASSVVVGGNPNAISISKGIASAYVTLGAQGEVIPFSTVTLLPGLPISIGGNPSAITLDALGETAFVVDTNHNKGWVLELSQKSTPVSFSLPEGPIALSYLPPSG
ncbi:MAG: YncE family protein [Acidimicrobiales bacterium]|nr:YncE family protein [Acidimicrobiales bacterium]